MIIGLAGLAGSGKNTVADILCELMPGTRQIAFADPLRRIAADLWDIHPHLMADPELKEIRIPEWGLSPRQILQRLGTEVGRQIHPETWTRYVERQINTYSYDGWIITDVRFPNEVALIDKLGGEVWWIEREGAGSQSGAGHSSETLAARMADDLDRRIDNSGTLMDLRQAVALTLNEALDCAGTA